MSEKRKSDKKTGKKVKATLEERHTREFVGTDKISYTHTPDYHGVYNASGIDNSFDFKKFKQGFRLQIQSLDEEVMVFDMIGVDAPIANAFRRILIAEVPTMCIESVYIQNNTSILPDEVLAHRLGLIPILADPREFAFHEPGHENDHTEMNTITFTMNVSCTANPAAKETDPEHVKYINSRVLSSDLTWLPQGDQEERHASHPLRPVHKDILIAKLRPGQEISLSCYCLKGYGKDHAKFSPVATASYRLLPEIIFPNGDIKNKEAQELVDMCPMNVFDIEDLGNDQTRARVAKPRSCTMCRECIRHPGWGEKVNLRRVKNHFIFSVESTGILPPQIIVEEAFKRFLQKVAEVRKAHDVACGKA